MSNRPATIRTSGQGTTVSVVGDVYRYLATGAETNGKYAMIDAIVPPGGGPPPHIHNNEEESFYVLDGEVTFRLGDQQLVATTGMFANVPVGLPHSFRNESNRPARMIITVAPAGLEKFFIEVGTQLPEGATQGTAPTGEDIAKLLATAPKYGIEILSH